MVRSSRVLIALFIILMMATGSIFAQTPDTYFKDAGGEYTPAHRCATYTPTMQETQQLQQDLKNWLASGNFTVQKATVTIPIAFHVVAHDDGYADLDDSYLYAQLDVLNAAYASTGFGFSMGSIDHTYNTKWSTHRYGSRDEKLMKEALAIDPATTFNMYFCDIGGGLLGYATFPYMYPEDDYMHGVVCLWGSVPGGWADPYAEGDTATHEAGHFLGLYHTFQGGCTVPNDYCDDTPQESTAAFGCPIGNDTCPDPGEDPVQNFMDYTDDYCMDHFTTDQSARMHEQMALYRPTMYGATTPSGPTANFTGSPTSGDYPLTVAFSDASTGTPTSWSWTFGDGGTATTQNPDYTYNAVGTYTVSLTVTNVDGSDTLTRNSYINVTEPGSGSGTMHVADITVTSSSQGRWFYGTGVVSIGDDSGAAVSGATVSVTYSGPTSGSLSGLTGTDGTVSFSAARGSSTGWCFEVTNVTHASLTYDAGANLVTRACEDGDVYRDQNLSADMTALHANHPNPFNPMTEISFTLKSESNVRLTIFNVKGQAVETLVNKTLGAGYYTSQWDGRSHPSGVYFYRLETREFSETRKMIMLK